MTAVWFMVKIGSMGLLAVMMTTLFFWSQGALSELIEVVFVQNWQAHKGYLSDLDKNFVYGYNMRYFSQKSMAVVIVLAICGFFFLWQDRQSYRYMLDYWFHYRQVKQLFDVSMAPHSELNHRLSSKTSELREDAVNNTSIPIFFDTGPFSFF